MQSISGFCKDETGQDLIEYTLLIAFVALCSGLLFTGAGNNVSKVWSTGSTTLSSGAVRAAS